MSLIRQGKGYQDLVIYTTSLGTCNIGFVWNIIKGKNGGGKIVFEIRKHNENVVVSLLHSCES